jgi:hypothetical protein
MDSAVSLGYVEDNYLEPHDAGDEEYVHVGYQAEKELNGGGHLPRNGGSGGYGPSPPSYGRQNRYRRGPQPYDIGLQDYTQAEEEGGPAGDNRGYGGRYSPQRPFRAAAAGGSTSGGGNNHLYSRPQGGASTRPGYQDSARPGYQDSPRAGYQDTVRPGYQDSTRPAYLESTRPGYQPQQEQHPQRQYLHQQDSKPAPYAIRGPQAYYEPGLEEEAAGGGGGGDGYGDEFGGHAGAGGGENNNNFEEYERLVEESHKNSIHGDGHSGDGEGGGVGGGIEDAHGLDLEDVHGVEIAAAAAVEEQIENDPRYNNNGFDQGGEGSNNSEGGHPEDLSSLQGGGDLFGNDHFQAYSDHQGGGGGGGFGSDGGNEADGEGGSNPFGGPRGFGGGPPHEEGGFRPSSQPPPGNYPPHQADAAPAPLLQGEGEGEGGQRPNTDLDYERYFTLHYDYDYEPANNNNSPHTAAAAPAHDDRGDQGVDPNGGGQGADHNGFEDIFADQRSARGQRSRGFGQF